MQHEIAVLRAMIVVRFSILRGEDALLREEAGVSRCGIARTYGKALHAVDLYGYLPRFNLVRPHFCYPYLAPPKTTGRAGDGRWIWITFWVKLGIVGEAGGTAFEPIAPQMVRAA
ncbi:hypothetical protein CVT25_012273 [Psilocybe cyanescens]|uniref:Uncharacterized protein n=1 Tax=Psilocybe cyanescens TaxID=93625 RepID=A0A409XH95_PSICY|nr:hypothetical protein CVT25_012273 [Psilocybe cyanescens]